MSIIPFEYIDESDMINETCPVTERWYIITMKVAVSVSSILSIIGALCIIATLYCCRCKPKKTIDEQTRLLDEVRGGDTRSIASGRSRDVVEKPFDKGQVVSHPAWLILAFISAADIVTAVSHIWGILNNYENEYLVGKKSHHEIESMMHDNRSAECGAQAVLAIFGVISSFLWSDVLALIAVSLRIISAEYNHHFVSVRAFVVYNFICWGLPFLIVCILGGIHALGFAEGVDVGWCYIHIDYHHKSWQIVMTGISYELWATGSMLWILVMVTIFAIVLCYKRHKRYTTEKDEIVGSWLMLSVAAILILLRVWATILDGVVLRSHQYQKYFECTTANAALNILAGVGNSSQGAVNFLLFILFRNCCKSNCCKKQTQD